MADGKQADVHRDVLELVEKKDDPQQEQDVVVAGHHVLCAQVGEGQEVYARYFLDVALVALGHCMCERVDTCQQKKSDHLECGHDKARPYPRCRLFSGFNFPVPKWSDPIVVTLHDVHQVLVGVRGVFFTKPDVNFANASVNQTLLHNGTQ